MRKAPQKDGKACCRCKIVKPRAEFPTNRLLADGLGAMCRLCKRASDKELRERKLGIVRPQDVAPSPIVPPKTKPAGKTPLKTKPTKCTPEVIAEICVHLERGHTRNSAAAGAGVLPKTFANWLKTAADPDAHKVFHDALDAVELAEAKGLFSLVEKVRDGAELDFNHAKWILERRDKEWQRHDQVEVSGDSQAVEINVIRELIFAKLDKLTGPTPASIDGAEPAAAPSPDSLPA